MVVRYICILQLVLNDGSTLQRIVEYFIFFLFHSVEWHNNPLLKVTCMKNQVCNRFYEEK